MGRSSAPTGRFIRKHGRDITIYNFVEETANTGDYVLSEESPITVKAIVERDPVLVNWNRSNEPITAEMFIHGNIEGLNSFNRSTDGAASEIALEDRDYRVTLKLYMENNMYQLQCTPLQSTRYETLL